MQIEVGSIVTGKVVSITKFGAFVDLEGKTGMIHISEIASTYVKEIRDFVTEGQELNVKVLSISPDGKISLSLKQAAPPAERPREEAPRPAAPRRDNRPPRQPDFSRPAVRSSEPQSFEEMMNRFKASSDDKLGDLKRRSNAGAAPRPRTGKDRRG